MRDECRKFVGYNSNIDNSKGIHWSNINYTKAKQVLLAKR